MRRASMFVLSLLPACPGEPPPTEADALGVGAQCAVNDDCNPEDLDSDGAQDQDCLTQFKGGYCGIRDCEGDADCPEASKCVAHTDGTNYCFRVCNDKGECNYNRSPENESNCSSNVTFVDGGGSKACVPPSG